MISQEVYISFSNVPVFELLGRVSEGKCTRNATVMYFVWLIVFVQMSGRVINTSIKSIKKISKQVNYFCNKIL